MRRLPLLLPLLAAAAFGQEFEVVSIKPNNSLSDHSGAHRYPERFSATNLSLKNLIVRAWDVKDYQVLGPDWLSTEHFDIDAKYSKPLPEDRAKYMTDWQKMMQAMLVQRFKLAVHRETRTLPAYVLVAGKDGPKVKQIPDCSSHDSSSEARSYTGTCVDLSTLADFLSRRLELPVIDHTDLPGYYDVTLKWFPESRTNEPAPGPALPVALEEQLGLKLEARKMPVEVIIVDHVERIPIEN